MDIYTQLEDKLRDMTNRMTQETRFCSKNHNENTSTVEANKNTDLNVCVWFRSFEMCDAKEQEAAQDGESSEEASRYK